MGVSWQQHDPWGDVKTLGLVAALVAGGFAIGAGGVLVLEALGVLGG